MTSVKSSPKSTPPFRSRFSSTLQSGTVVMLCYVMLPFSFFGKFWKTTPLWYRFGKWYHFGQSTQKKRCRNSYLAVHNLAPLGVLFWHPIDRGVLFCSNSTPGTLFWYPFLSEWGTVFFSNTIRAHSLYSMVKRSRKVWFWLVRGRKKIRNKICSHFFFLSEISEIFYDWNTTDRIKKNNSLSLPCRRKK